RMRDLFHFARLSTNQLGRPLRLVAHGGDDPEDRVALVAGLEQRAAAAERLVIWMRTDRGHIHRRPSSLAVIPRRTPVPCPGSTAGGSAHRPAACPSG